MVVLKSPDPSHQRRKHSMRIAAALLAAFLLIKFVWIPLKSPSRLFGTPMYGTRIDWEHDVRIRYPAGSSVARAKEELERLGLKCHTHPPPHNIVACYCYSRYILTAVPWKVTLLTGANGVVTRVIATNSGNFLGKMGKPACRIPPLFGVRSK